MPSSTEARTAPAPTSLERWRPGVVAAWVDALRDLRHLLAFNGATVRHPRAVRIGLALLIGLTALFAWTPVLADTDSSLLTGAVGDLRLTLVYAFPVFFLMALGASLGGGGGRELLPRDQAWPHPVSSFTEHLGSLLLAPLNLVWLLQWWALLAVTAFAVGDGPVLGAQALVCAWVVAATAMAQALGWVVEGVRRLPYGIGATRVAGVLLAAAAVGLQATGWLARLAESLWTVRLVDLLGTDRWWLGVVVLLAVTAVAVVVGGYTARWALSLPPREELRVESGVHPARAVPVPRFSSPESAMVRRLDRGSVWRSVGMRRGFLVLGIGPGLVAVIGNMDWSQVMVLPGLAASGGALLFGVNAWCLDGRGAVWRETLPVDPRVTFAARTRVVAESLLAVAGLTVLMASLRNGVPPFSYAFALLVLTGVVVLQVVATSMHWSVRRPHAVNLSSPRATPAPPAQMLGYAAKLSLTTTLTGLLFGGLGMVGAWWLTVAVALPFVAWSSWRLLRARRVWLDPAARAQIALTVVP
ncbi:MAG: hypothetical protein ACI379_13645 [Nocardioides sp.]|uniref:hypothetical protein n=1 Tax=Nocardioides sp. TaxID=35761 RepID=UPI003EFC9603